MQVAKVILDIQSNQFSKPLDFVILPGKSPQVEFDSDKNYEAEVGCVVVIPFGKQFKLGFIIGEANAEELSRPVNSLKPIAGVISDSFFTKENVELAKFVSEKYLCSFATALRLFIPSGSMPKLKHVSDK